MKTIELEGFIVRDEGGQITIRQRTSIPGRIAISAFMLFWLTGWSAGCVALVSDLIAKFSWFSLLFTIPFLVGWLAGAAVLLTTVFGRIKVRLGKDYLEQVNSLLFSKTIEIPYKEISNVEVRQTDDSYQVVVLSSGQDLEILSRSNEKQAAALCEFLIAEIPTLDDPMGIVKPGDSRQPTNSHKPARERTARPRNCSWSFEENSGRETMLVNRGNLEITPLFLSIGINLFWNGIVGVFIVKLVVDFKGGNFAWGEALFLTPFVLIGLAMIAYLFFLILDPFRKIIYRFADHEIESSWRYFGLGPTKHTPVFGPVTISIQEDALTEDRNFSDGCDYELRVSAENKSTGTGDLLRSISPLTLAECEWMATELARYRTAYRYDREVVRKQDDSGPSPNK